MTDKSAINGAARGQNFASGPSAGPSWNILKKCLGVGLLGLAVMAILAFFFTDVHGMLSVLFASLLVMAFFGLSLLVGHLVAKRKPQAVMNAFFLSYIVKVFGFAGVLLSLGVPTWLNKPWFAGSAVVSVLLWQATEVVVFSKQRFLLFNEDAPGTGTQTSNSKDSSNDQ
ncbi:hypothetical protein AOC05_10165 [Arthrobacter alpinus]|uniref:ATP synthase protein I n=1 Tax=Arthrobacter alpinus TaxID=656366 RepID=A0A0M5LXP7_9MICC|nr:hypothetical protein [Arthrobacter alpinus]ALE92587.1 hypothetical protein AOC05_10165 [Arthrobacter alpinus]